MYIHSCIHLFISCLLRPIHHQKRSMILMRKWWNTELLFSVTRRQLTVNTETVYTATILHYLCSYFLMKVWFRIWKNIEIDIVYYQFYISLHFITQNRMRHNWTRIWINWWQRKERRILITLFFFWQYVKNQSINPPSREYVAGKTKPTVQQNEKCLPSARYIFCVMIMLKDDTLNLSIRHIKRNV